MNFEQHCAVAAPREKVWTLLMDVPEVATCVPGVGKVEQAEDNTFKGVMSVSVGPIRLSLDGKIYIQEQDREDWKATMRAEAAEKRVGGGMNATMALSLLEPAAGQTEIVIHTNANLLGRLGEFGQPVIRKKADSVMQEFARNLQAKLTSAT